MSVSKARADGFIEDSSTEDTKAGESLFLSDGSDEPESKSREMSADPPASTEKQPPETSSGLFGKPSPIKPFTNPSQPNNTSPFSTPALKPSPFSSSSISSFGRPSTTTPFANPQASSGEPSTSPFPAHNTPKFNFFAPATMTSGTPQSILTPPSNVPSKPIPDFGLSASTFTVPRGTFGQPTTVAGHSPGVFPTITNSNSTTEKPIFSSATPSNIKAPPSNTLQAIPKIPSLLSNNEPDKKPPILSPPTFVPAQNEHSKASVPFQNESTPQKTHSPAPFSFFSSNVNPPASKAATETPAFLFPNSRSGTDTHTPVSSNVAKPVMPKSLFSMPGFLSNHNSTDDSSKTPLSGPTQLPEQSLGTSHVQITSTAADAGNQPLKSRALTPTATIPPIQINIDPPKPDPRPEALDQLANAAVCENDGFLQQFLEYTVSPIIHKAISQLQKQRVREEIGQWNLTWIISGK